MFQGIGLFPHMTVAENVAVPLRLARAGRASAPEARVAELLALVELDAVARRAASPAALSGGEQQRVGVARALAASPRVMLLDEPFGALDPLTRDRLQRSFDELRRRLALTAVFVTHDVAEALVLADRIGVMRAGRLRADRHAAASWPATPRTTTWRASSTLRDARPASWPTGRRGRARDASSSPCCRSTSRPTCA